MFWFKPRRPTVAQSSNTNPIADRTAILLDGVEKHHLGLEIGPWHSPLVPKSAGYRSMSLDYVDEAELKRRAQTDPHISDELVEKIEPVDFVGTADQMGAMVERAGLSGSFDYVISSHNLEHLPNPIKFLCDARQLLKPDGRLILAVPDKRMCFDYFKPISTTADFIEAFLENRDRPSAKQVFSQTALFSRYDDQRQQLESFHLGLDPRHVRPTVDLETLKKSVEYFQRDIGRPDAPYYDVHCWTFTPASLELLLKDLFVMELMEFGVDSISPTNGQEFYVHLSPATVDEAFRSEYQERRVALLHRIQHDTAEYSATYWGVVGRG